MGRDATRTQGEGALSGVLAGVGIGAAEVVASSVNGAPLVTPFRAAASILLGARALVELSPGAAILVGGMVHLVLSIAFGWAYGLATAALTADVRRSPAIGAILGAAYGTLLWLVSFQIVARLAFPWLATVPQGQQWLLHAAFYGVPLGLLLASSERGYARATRGRPAMVS